MKGDLDTQAAYLRLLQPDRLPQLFKSSMTPQILLGILMTVLKRLLPNDLNGAVDENGSFGAKLLQSLTRVDRFAVNAMLIPGRDKKGLSQDWDSVLAHPGLAGDTEALSDLRKAYKM